jgi:hypothetical protein
MLRPSILLGLASVAVAGFVLNCGDDETPATPTPTNEGGTTPPPTPTTPTPPVDSGAEGGGDGGTDAGPVVSRTVFAVDDTAQLITFTTNAPATVTKVAITGLAVGETIQGIDFRPVSGTLYALANTGKVYTLETTGAASALAGDAGAVPTFPIVLDVTATSFGFDFNPFADRIRVHTNTGKNYRLHPADGQSVNVGGDPDLTYTDGGASAPIVATAYTNSVRAQPAATQLFGIDTQLDQLVTFAGPPGFEMVSPVGPLGVNAEEVAGFDIFGGQGGGDGGIPAVTFPVEAYAALRVGITTNLYTINLGTGKATLLGPINHNKALRGIALQPPQ